MKDGFLWKSSRGPLALMLCLCDCSSSSAGGFKGLLIGHLTNFGRLERTRKNKAKGHSGRQVRSASSLQTKTSPFFSFFERPTSLVGTVGGVDRGSQVGVFKVVL